MYEDLPNTMPQQYKHIHVLKRLLEELEMLEEVDVDTFQGQSSLNTSLEIEGNAFNSLNRFTVFSNVYYEELKDSINKIISIPTHRELKETLLAIVDTGLKKATVIATKPQMDELISIFTNYIEYIEGLLKNNGKGQVLFFN